VLAPKSNVVEVADLVSQWGRQKFKARFGEHLDPSLTVVLEKLFYISEL
jgi:hypothetical protein